MFPYTKYIHCLQSAALQSTRSVLYTIALRRWTCTSVFGVASQRPTADKWENMWNNFYVFAMALLSPQIYHFQLTICISLALCKIWNMEKFLHTCKCWAVVLCCVVWRRRSYGCCALCIRLCATRTRTIVIAININNKCWHLMGDQFSK